FGGAKKEDKDEDKYKDDKPSRVSSVSSVKGRMMVALQKMGLGGLGGGGGGGRGYGSGDLGRWKGRFKDGSGFKGGNVATGPSAGAKTKIGGKGTRMTPDSKTEQMAKSAAQRFGEMGQTARAVDPKTALSNLAGAVPTELGGKGNKDDAKADAPKEYNLTKDNEKDPGAGVEPVGVGEALGNLFLGLASGIGFAALGGAIGGAEGSIPGQISSKLVDTGIDMGMEGVKSGFKDLTNPNWPIDECKGKKAGAPSIVSGGD
ncbi:MAG: hypothetical protein AAB091_07800, partial [Elusimicrobiota bacterium]